MNLSIHGLRGLSAFLVVLAHAYGMAVTGGFFKDRGHVSIGDLGVNLFFMISGYLIIKSLYKNPNVIAFLKNRLIRIYPVFLTLHIVLFIFGPIIHYEWLGEVEVIEYIGNFLSNMFFLPGIFDLPLAQKNAWSLSYEICFYLVAGMFFTIHLKLQPGILKTLSLIVLSLGCLVMFYYYPRTVFFLVGVLTYFMKNKYPEIKVHRSISMVILIVLVPISGLNFYLSFVFATVLFITIAYENGWASKLLRMKVFQYLGTISYSLYLIHPFAFFPLKFIFSKLLTSNNEYVLLTAFSVIGIIIALIGSHFSYKYIEDWFTNKYLKNKRSTKTTTVKVQVQ